MKIVIRMPEDVVLLNGGPGNTAGFLRDTVRQGAKLRDTGSGISLMPQWVQVEEDGRAVRIEIDLPGYIEEDARLALESFGPTCELSDSAGITPLQSAWITVEN